MENKKTIAQEEKPKKVIGPSGEIMTYEEWLEWKENNS